MDAQTEDVVGVLSVEVLSVLNRVVRNAQGGHVVHNVPVLEVEQVVPTVVAAISEI